MKILLISGKSASGKDALADALYTELFNQEKKVLRIHFGDPVKWLAKLAYNWDGNKDVAGRELLQTLGTTKMRSYDNTYWARIISEYIAAITPYNDFDYVIIPDLRFMSEFETICAYNNDVVTIRVNRYDTQGRPYYNPKMTIKQLTHISECELDHFNFEYIIENSGSLDDLADAAHLLLEDLTK